MKQLLIITFALFVAGSIRAQDEEEEDTHTQELGFDGFVSASTLGGAFGLGVKYAIIKQKNIAFGPSIRLQRFWSNYYGSHIGFNIYGGGVFAHYRYKNLLFAGAEFEMLKSPQNWTYALSPKTWVPTLFVGGGFSKGWEPAGVRLNAGIYYDIINHPNSPFRTSYVARNSQGVLMPIIYRIGFFFNIN